MQSFMRRMRSVLTCPITTTTLRRVLQVLAHLLDFLAHVVHLVAARLKVVVVIGQVNTDLILRIKECIEKKRIKKQPRLMITHQA